MYTSSREILKGGRILDQPLTCSLSKMHSLKLISIRIGISSWIPNTRWNSSLNTDLKEFFLEGESLIRRESVECFESCHPDNWPLSFSMAPWCQFRRYPGFKWISHGGSLTSCFDKNITSMLKKSISDVNAHESCHPENWSLGFSMTPDSAWNQFIRSPGFKCNPWRAFVISSHEKILAICWHCLLQAVCLIQYKRVALLTPGYQEFLHPLGRRKLLNTPAI